MTDEQVKKGLECCADSNLDCSTKVCPYFRECYSAIGNEKQIFVDALALINRLEEEKEQIRKETAKSIIHELKREVYLAIGTFNPILARELRTLYLRLQQEYGIEEEE